MADRTLTVRRLPIADLHLDPANARAHGDTNMQAITASLQRFGQAEPLVVQAGTGRIIGGNGRMAAMRALGWQECDVVELEVDDLQATALGIALNRTGELAEWDTPVLAKLLGDLQEAGALDGVGFDEAELDELMGQLADEIAEPTEDEGAVDPPAEAISREGDTWILGDHRLRCGSSTSLDDVRTLMDGDVARWMWTDPPYGVNYEGGTGLTIKNDSPEGLPALLRDAFHSASAVLEEGAPIYVAHPAGPLALEFMRAFIDAGWKLHETLVWVKNSLVLGHSDYHYRHEPVLYGWKGKNRRWFGDRCQDSVFEVARPSRSEDHPTSKPVTLITDMLRNSSRRGDVGFEPFSGSGSTLMAAEALGLRCRAMELDPRYIDAAVIRWEKATGKDAVLHSTEQRFEAVAELRA